MNIFIFIAGSIILAIAITFLIKYCFLQGSLQAIRATETANLAQLRTMQTKMRLKGRSDTWREQVEVKGIVRSSRPLMAELSQLPCVYCQTKVAEEFQRTPDGVDRGETGVSSRRGTKLINDRQNQTNFYLEDATDKIFIDLAEAEIDGMTVINEFESCCRQKSPDYRVVGYQRTEKIIELGSEIYIIGEAKEIDGRLQIGASNNLYKPFVISFKSQAELLQGTIAQGKHKLFWGLGLGILGSMAIACSRLAI